jgi:hypothetical protein
MKFLVHGKAPQEIFTHLALGLEGIARVKFLEHGSQVGQIHVGVNLCRGNISMAKYFLDNPKVAPSRE